MKHQYHIFLDMCHDAKLNLGMIFACSKNEKDVTKK